MKSKFWFWFLIGCFISACLYGNATHGIMFFCTALLYRAITNSAKEKAE